MKADFLKEILASRRRQVAADRAASPRIVVPAGKGKRHFRAALQAEEIAIIAEFKRASPSVGEIPGHAEAAEMAALYQAGGARAISVLTEPKYFRGSLEDLCAVRQATGLPILRKDFIVDEFQIEEAAAAGANAVLLIVAALSDIELRRFRVLAEEELGLDALVEVHNADEMRRASRSGARLIGVNNRDLRTFATSLETSVELAALAPNDATLVSESGLSSHQDIQRLRECGYRGFLVGESLMRAADPAALLRSLRHAGV